MTTARFGLLGLVLLALVALAQDAPTPTVAPSGDVTSDTSSGVQNGGAVSQPDPEPREQIVSDTGYFVVARSAHERTWQRIVELLDENGETQSRTNAYVELATGMHIWSEEKTDWIEASDEIEILQEGAIARKSQHQAAFAGNLTDPNGTIDLLTPDGKRLRSRVVGLAYTETDTGKSVFIAEIKDSQGFVLGRNQVAYLDAFDTIKADIRYTTTRSSFEQDIILRETLLSPSDLEFKPERTLVEVWTEFLNPPEPVKNSQIIARADGSEASDESLDFGTMRTRAGQAYSIGPNRAESDMDPGGLAVAKQWQTIDGRTFLIEAVPFLEMTQQLQGLPARQTAKADGRARRELLAKLSRRSGARQMAVSRRRSPGARVPSAKPISLARAGIRERNALRRDGYYLDYVIINSGSTDYVFMGDTTYFVTAPVWLSGIPTFEGGTVIKDDVYSSTNYVALNLSGPAICKTSSFRPAIITCRDDNSIGEIIAGSTGSPSGYYGYRGLAFWSSPSPTSLENVRISYAVHGYSASVGTSNQLRNAQLINCYKAVAAGSNSTVRLRNVLIAKSYTPLYVLGSTFSGENLTISEASNLYGDATGTTFYLTNSLVIAVASGVNFSGSNNATNSSTNVFQTVGAGNYYLAANSSYRNAGTTAIHEQLLADLKKKTTYPPVVLTNDFAVYTVLSPQAQRDADVPDLGFHYDPIDWMWTSLQVNNTTVLLTNGVAIANYGTKGTVLASGSAQLSSQGSPTNPNHLVRSETVQEQPINLGSGGAGRWLIEVTAGIPAELHLRHTDISILAAEYSKRLLLLNNGGLPVSFTANDCYFRGVYTDLYRSSSATTPVLALVNNLFERSQANFGQNTLPAYLAYSLELSNNLFSGGYVTLNYSTNTTVWTVRDNFFDCDQLYRYSLTLSASNNGYRSGLTALPGDPSPKTGLVSDYQSGPMTNHLGYLGNYYYPTSGSSTSLTNLINTGSRTASVAGLYHHTTQTNQTKEATSQVDIGFHYIALDGNGLPNDYDSDGLPDYLEDKDGDGAVDSGETNWQDAFNSGLKVLITEPKSNSNIP